MAESYNGWPASPDKDAIGVVQSHWFPGGAKAGDVTTVLRYVAEQMDARVEGIVGGWCWGYNYRANANNPNSLSCHASGTAIDWNAPEHPNGSVGTFSDEQRGEIYKILDEVQGAVHWLDGVDGGTADEMHFEICVDADTLARIAAELPGHGPKPQPIPDIAGVDNMFVTIPEVGFYAVVEGVLYTFRDIGAAAQSQANSPGIGVLNIPDSTPLQDRQEFYNNLVARHHAALR